MNKKLIRLTESDLHRIVKESVNKIINEIGDTPKGQRALGALHARKVLRNNDLSDDTYNYAQNARGGDKYDNRGNNENPLYHDYANGYIDYLNSHPDEYIANKRKRMSESYLHRIVKESVNRVLKEGVEFSSEDPQEEWMYYQNKLQQEFDELGVMVLNKIPRNDPDRQIIQRYIRMIQAHLHTLES